MAELDDFLLAPCMHERYENNIVIWLFHFQILLDVMALIDIFRLFVMLRKMCSSFYIHSFYYDCQWKKATEMTIYYQNFNHQDRNIWKGAYD